MKFLTANLKKKISHQWQNDSNSNSCVLNDSQTAGKM